MVIAIALIGALYLGDLAGMGMVGPDEPRYAAIGRTMAESGDWITPRLWGNPWFEKSALLYWLTATGFKLGFGPDLAPRLPVALLSVAFLGFFWWRLRIEWHARAAWFATALLATSAGWLAYSHVAVTDLPLAAFFSAALLLSLPWIERGDSSALPAAAACLGLAALAKGLVPLVLFFPVLAIGWRRIRDWFRPAPLLAFGICALPWYILCTVRNGVSFLRVFFVEQQFGRFSSDALQHVQPWWFYVPAALLLLFPWFPLLGFASRGLPDRRLRVLGIVVLFGFVFFSASVNKLPSYLLPLLPATMVILGVLLSTRAAQATRIGVWMVAPVALIGLLPALPDIVATSLGHGLRAAGIPWTMIGVLLLAATAIGFVLAVRLPADRTFAAVALLAAAGFIWFQIRTFPKIDAAASARPLWLVNHPACITVLPVRQPRSIAYGLYYYSEHRLPECAVPDTVGMQGVR